MIIWSMREDSADSTNEGQTMAVKVSFTSKEW